jgi:hypothetical protein
MHRSAIDRVQVIGIAIALVAPPLLTIVLVRLPPASARAYVFLYLGVVASQTAGPGVLAISTGGKSDVEEHDVDAPGVAQHLRCGDPVGGD